jgi:hypothetical protein
MAATPRGPARGDLGDPSGRKETPMKAPQGPLGGVGGLRWRVGIARGHTMVARVGGERQRQTLSPWGQKRKHEDKYSTCSAQ